jgi:hypothetical protein
MTLPLAPVGATPLRQDSDTIMELYARSVARPPVIYVIDHALPSTTRAIIGRAIWTFYVISSADWHSLSTECLKAVGPAGITNLQVTAVPGHPGRIQTPIMADSQISEVTILVRYDSR